jgi:hypothetical protein
MVKGKDVSICAVSLYCNLCELCSAVTKTSHSKGLEHLYPKPASQKQTLVGMLLW